MRSWEKRIKNGRIQNNIKNRKPENIRGMTFDEMLIPQFKKHFCYDLRPPPLSSFLPFKVIFNIRVISQHLQFRIIFSFFKNFPLQTHTEFRTLEMGSHFRRYRLFLFKVCSVISVAINYPHFPVRYGFRKNNS